MNYYTNSELAAIRQAFPILNTTVNNHPLVYLDNAATSQKPLTVINALADFYKYSNANPNRGPHYLSDLATYQVEAARAKIAKFINADHLEECIFTKNTTEALNLIAHSFGAKFLAPGDEIILTIMEHHANIVPWQLLQAQKQLNLKIVPILDPGELDLATLEKLFTPKTKLLSLSHVSNTLGTINPINAIIKLAHAHNVPVIIDGAQAISHFKIDVSELDCDFYVFSGHKMFGPTGIGILYGKRSYLTQMPPYQGGGQMIAKVSFGHTTFAPLPYKFEAGTQPLAAAVGLGAAIDYLSQLDFKKLALHEQELLNYAVAKLQTIPGLKIIGNSQHKIGIISFTLDRIHPHDVGTILNNYGIAIRTGHMCTMPLLEHYKIQALNRVSFSIYNTCEEIDSLYNGLLEVKKIFNT